MKNKTLITFLAFFLLIAKEALPQDGQLDETFGNGGIVTTAFNVFGHSSLNATVKQSDGRIIAAGTYYNKDNYDFAVTRFNLDGSLDNTFGVNGIVTNDFTGYKDEAYSVAIQTDGKIVVAGYSEYAQGNNITHFTLARYNTDGGIDSTFGENGIAVADFNLSECVLHTVVIQSDGKIVGAGYSKSGDQSVFALARFNTNGSLDNTFGINGQQTTPMVSSNEGIQSATILNNGKIVVAGYYALARYNENGSVDSSFGTNGITSYPGLSGKYIAIEINGKIIAGGNFDSHFALACFNENGIPDSTFGTDGIVKTPIGLASEIKAIRIQSSGKIIAVGNAYFEAPTNYLALASYDMNGVLDADFGTNGIVARQIGTWYNEISSAEVQTDEKIIVAGSSNYGNGGYQHFNLTCFNSNGTLYDGFGINGIADVEIGKSESFINSLAIQSDGKIIALGNSNTVELASATGFTYEFVLTRFNHNGTFDNSFGLNGIVTTPIGTGSEEANSMVIQSDGKIVVAGRVDIENQTHFALARYITNGILDNTFGNNGIVTTSIGTSGFAVARSMVIQNDGKIILAGNSVNENSAFTLARYTINGSLDNSFGTHGILIDPIGTSGSYAYSAALQGDGKIIVGGIFEDGMTDNYAIVRYNPNGTRDTTFGTNGMVNAPLGKFANALSILIQGDNKIIATGPSGDGFKLVRFNGDGTLDSTFGTNGIANMPIYNNNEAFSAIQSDGKIVVAGYTFIGSYKTFTTTRFKTNGTLDNTFGKNGIVTTTVGSSQFAQPRSVVIQDDGNIVIGGYSGIGIYYTTFCLLRYTGGTVTGINEYEGVNLQTSLVLEQNYPNPFDFSTRIRYQVPVKGPVSLKVYDMTGREVKTLVNENQNAGLHEVDFLSGNLNSGIYLYKLTSGNNASTRIMVISR